MFGNKNNNKYKKKILINKSQPDCLICLNLYHSHFAVVVETATTGLDY